MSQSVGITAKLMAARAINDLGRHGLAKAVSLVGVEETLGLYMLYLASENYRDADILERVEELGMLTVMEHNINRAVVYSLTSGEVQEVLEIVGGFDLENAEVQSRTLLGTADAKNWMKGPPTKTIFAGREPYTEAKESFLQYYKDNLTEMVEIGDL